MAEIKLKPGWLRESIEEAGRKLKQIEEATYQDNPDKPCYAPSTWCVTHDCFLDTCWKKGRCSTLYAMGLT